jgi:metallophosphoesterase superfamily enzyme
MNVKVTDTVVLELCQEFGLDVPLMVKAIKERYPDYKVRPYRIVNRINKLRAKGMLALDSGNYVSSGEILKSTSTLYDEDGNVKIQWVKTEREKQDVLDDVRAVIDAYVEDLPKFKKVEYNVTYTSSDLMAVYPLGDPHIGMKAYKEESGTNWDLKTAQEVFCGVFDRLVKTAPHCEKAVIVNLGDYFHRDNVAGVTERHRHVLDTDGNYMMMVDTGLKIMIQMITSALEHHQQVQVITTIGNHDDTGSMFLQAALKHMYQDEPRVDIGCTSSVFQYFEHGKCFFGVHHGHTCKAEKLPLVMATDRPKEWGNSQFRYFLTG